MIKLINVWKEYLIDEEIKFLALKNASITIKENEFLSIIGPSGSGKSTLMHILGLLDKPTRGEVLIDNQKVSTMTDDQISSLRNKKIGFVFQQFNLISRLTVIENIILPVVYSRQKVNFDPEKKALELIKRFNLEGKEKSYPNKLSGGQQQRVAIARALIMDPEIILADEPTGNLDSKNGQIILELLEKLHFQDKRTIIIVTHDLEIAKRAKKVIKIKDGELFS